MQNIIKVDSKIRCKTSDLHIEPYVVRISEAFDPEMTDKFYEDFNKAIHRNNNVIPVIIDSYGGQVYSLLQIISTFKSSPLPIATICTGKAMSCGAMLFIFGHNGLRFMSEEATIMLHEVSSISIGKVEEIKSDAKEVDRLNKKIFTEAALHIGKPANYFLDLLHKHNHSEIYMTAKDAKKHNICNHIGVPTLKTEVIVEQSLSVNGKEIQIN
jgi:ATP-dependent Clp endopeptidase proteolytic subunit ClpP